MSDCRDSVGVHLAALVDRDVFAGDETFVCEVKPDLVRNMAYQSFKLRLRRRIRLFAL
jgi:hypothetical protein